MGPPRSVDDTRRYRARSARSGRRHRQRARGRPRRRRLAGRWRKRDGFCRTRTTMARLADEALIGRTLAGKFVVESFIGGGAMGAVYRAKQLSLDKAVAIKVLHADLSDPSFTARFQREAKAASKLDHHNSMRVLDYGKDTD